MKFKSVWRTFIFISLLLFSIVVFSVYADEKSAPNVAKNNKRNPEKIADEGTNMLKESVGFDDKIAKQVHEIILNNETEKILLEEKIKNLDLQSEDKIRSLLNKDQRAKFDSSINELRGYHNQRILMKDESVSENEIDIVNRFINKQKINDEKKLQIRRIIRQHIEDLGSIEEVAFNDFINILSQEQKENLRLPMLDRDDKKASDFESTLPKRKIEDDKNFGFRPNDRHDEQNDELPQSDMRMHNSHGKTFDKPPIPNIYALLKMSDRLDLNNEQKEKLKEIINNRQTDMKFAQDFFRDDLKKILPPEQFGSLSSELNKLDKK